MSKHKKLGITVLMTDQVRSRGILHQPVRKDTTTIAGYRLVGKDEEIRCGDVCGWVKKYPIDMDNWKDELAGEFNQAVFRPLASFVDLIEK